MAEYIAGGEREESSGGSVFDVASKAFWLLVTGPNPIAIDGRVFDGFPDRLVPLNEVRRRLLAARRTDAMRDQVWAHVIERARAERGAWTVGCVGLALPGLITAAARLVGPYAADPADVYAAMLAGFLEELARIDTGKPWIMQRLQAAARAAGIRVIREELDRPTPVDERFRSEPPPAPWGHPDLVLARAVADGVITAAQAEMIGATRLEEISARDYAAAHGINYDTFLRTRLRAERKLVAYLTGAFEGDDSTTADTDLVDCVAARLALAPDRRNPRAQSHPVTSRRPGQPRKSRRRVSENGRCERS